MNNYYEYPYSSESSGRTAADGTIQTHTMSGGAPGPGGSGRNPNAHTKRGASKFIAVLCACVLTSSVAGFGGGYLAITAANAGQQAQSAPVSSPNAQAPAANISAPGANGMMTTAEVVNSVSDTVVEIATQVQTNYRMQQVTGEAAGSGVIISQDGYIITNNHVIDGAQSITVRLKNGESYPAKLVGTDEQTDIAVIKVEAAGLNAAVLGSSSELQVGDDVIAIGNPLGELGGTVTNGIVSAVSREVTIENETMTLLQTNAAINPGNSGGGLFNNRGELIGIVVAKSSGSGVEGLGFAVPIDVARSVADDLMSSGYVTGRGKLGVSLLDVSDPRMALMYRLPQNGVYVAGLEDGSSAALAGMKVGDGIVAVGETEITSSAELKAELGKHKAGDALQLTIVRDAQKITLNVTLQEYVPEAIKGQAA